MIVVFGYQARNKRKAWKSKRKLKMIIILKKANYRCFSAKVEIKGKKRKYKRQRK